MPLPDGRLDWRGIAGPDLEVVARSDTAIVAWQRGYASNSSGIRGMPNVQYVPARHIVFGIEEVQADGMIRVSKLVEWTGRGQRARPLRQEEG